MVRWGALHSRSAKTGDPLLLPPRCTREQGYPRVWVNSIVVFTRPEVRLKVASTTVPVLYLTELRDYLHRQEQQVLASEACRDIAACLSELIPADGRT
jgi:hypothetical protein